MGCAKDKHLCSKDDHVREIAPLQIAINVTAITQSHHSRRHAANDNLQLR